MKATEPSVTSRIHAMPFGAQVEPDHSVRFRLWSPSFDAPRIVVDEGAPLAMQPLGDGLYEHRSTSAGHGSRYAFVVGGGMRVPDPASRFQPDDVHGPSAVVDPLAYHWKDGTWQGRPWHETVLYELHVGTFTPEGTYPAAAERLDELVALGITAVELMPLSEAPGRWNWGYDGVLPFAPEHRYGSPDDLKAFVDAAHARGLMVFLDVVYNHFGPDGNYLHAYAAQFFTERHHTPWGAAVNVDGERSPTVRDFFVHNALYWLEEYHIDGLRLDAVDRIRDDSPYTFLRELAQRVRAAFRDRYVHLVLENDNNEASLLRNAYDGQWNDDVHHILHALVTGEGSSYYADYVDDPHGRLARALATGFSYQNEYSPFRERMRGTASADLPPTSFVNFLQNHDQIGNRAFGDRIGAIAPEEAVRAAEMVVALSPQIPLFFMGEEWAASTPFLFFADFEGDLARAVREGRRNEFAAFHVFADPAMLARIPDPGSAETVGRSTLVRDDVQREPHASHRAFVAKLLAVRARELFPRLAGTPGDAACSERFDRTGILVTWLLGDRSRLTLVANLSRDPATFGAMAPPAGRRLAATGTFEAHGLGPWSAAVLLVDPS